MNSLRENNFSKNPVTSFNHWVFELNGNHRRGLFVTNLKSVVVTKGYTILDVYILKSKQRLFFSDFDVLLIAAILKK